MPNSSYPKKPLFIMDIGGVHEYHSDDNKDIYRGRDHNSIHPKGENYYPSLAIVVSRIIDVKLVNNKTKHAGAKRSDFLQKERTIYHSLATVVSHMTDAKIETNRSPHAKRQFKHREKIGPNIDSHAVTAAATARISAGCAELDDSGMIPISVQTLQLSRQIVLCMIINIGGYECL
jgi:hypothetical protein